MCGLLKRAIVLSEEEEEMASATDLFGEDVTEDEVELGHEVLHEV